MTPGQIVIVNEKGEEEVFYEPMPNQALWHASSIPNLLGLGNRGGGKSKMLRNDAYMRCLMTPNFHALIIRRTMPELRESHLKFVPYEVNQIGGVFLSTISTVRWAENGSTLTFRHCETEADVMNFLSTQYGFIGFDEMSTFSLEQFLLISAASRGLVDVPYISVVRATSNPLGIGSDWMYDWFVDKTVRVEDFPDYNPDEYATLPIMMEDNIHLDRKTYTARLRNLPEHIRRAWLLGERVVEGMYFMDYLPRKDDREWHVIHDLPRVGDRSILDKQWLNIYRALDWGYWPDPAVCLWIAVLPNKRAIVFKERVWRKTLAADVAKSIKRESEGMKIVETVCDSSMFITSGVSPFSVGDIFEQNGVPLRPCENDREEFGYAIHDYLNSVIVEGETEYPQVQLLKSTEPGMGCPNLIRTLPRLRMDSKNPVKIAEGDDHYAVALAYFCTAQAAPSQDPKKPIVPRWMVPRRRQGCGRLPIPLISGTL